MKTTKTTTQQDTLISTEKLNNNAKPRSLRPMRSMVAVRSFKPKTVAAAIIVAKAPEQVQAN